MSGAWQNNRENSVGATHSSPEILPPEGSGEEPRAYYQQPQSFPQQPPPPQKRSRWAYAPATYILVGINCLVFLGMALSGISITSPSPDQLLTWGADFGPYVLILGEWWRLL